MSDNEKRIIGFTGARGSGKSSLALNLALAWAGTQDRAVLIVACPSPRKNASSRRSMDSAALLKLRPMGLGRPAALSSFGVGVARADASIEPSAVMGEISRLSETCDIFLDVDQKFPMKDAVLSACRRIFLLTLPGKGVKGILPPRCERVVNRARRERKGPDAIIHLPYDRAVPLYNGAGRLLIIERIQSPWIGALRPLLLHLMDSLGKN